MRPDIVHTMGRVRVIHPSDGNVLALVGEVDFLLTFCRVHVVCVRECVNNHG